jgi:hypothetical protein
VETHHPQPPPRQENHQVGGLERVKLLNTLEKIPLIQFLSQKNGKEIMWFLFP